MAQNTVSDFLASSASSLGGLWALVNVNGSHDAQANDAFSTLLSDQKTSQSTSLTALATTDSTPPASTPTTSSSQNETTSLKSRKIESTDTQLAQLRSLSSALRQALSRLQQQNKAQQSSSQNTTTVSSKDSTRAQPANTTASSTATPADSTPAKDSGQAASDTVNGSAKASAPPTSGDTTDTASRDDASTTSPAGDLTTLLSQLLAATQTIIQQLQQNQPTTDGLFRQASANGGTDELNLNAAVAPIDAYPSTGTDSSLGADSGLGTATAADSIQNILTLLAKINKQITTQDAGITRNTSDAKTLSTASPSVNTDKLATTAGTASLDPTVNQQLGAWIDKIKNLGAAAKTPDNDNPLKTTVGQTDDANKNSSTSTKARTNITTTDNAATVAASLNMQAPTPPPTSVNSLNTPLNFGLTTATTNPHLSSDDGFDASSRGGSSTNLAGLDTNSTNNAANNVAGTPRFADQMTALRATNATTTAQQPSAVDQVILQLNRSVKNGNDQMSLQLHPADMGKITVKLDFSHDGKVQGTITADNQSTLDLLQKDSRSLERALQDAGLRTDSGSLSFNLGNPSEQNKNKTANGEAADQENDAGTKTAQDDTGLAAFTAGAETYYLTPQGVNIRV